MQQPVAVEAHLRKRRVKADYLYEPGAYRGRYRVDRLWFGDKDER
ncbi:hypothetical protein [Pelagibius marinus]|nr:hypothetical protein [Pelagibius marinus]